MLARRCVCLAVGVLCARACVCVCVVVVVVVVVCKGAPRAERERGMQGCKAVLRRVAQPAPSFEHNTLLWAALTPVRARTHETTRAQARPST
jgi:hypothetical protein